MEQHETEKLIGITYDEIKEGWPRFMMAVVKRIRKRAGISKLTPEHIGIINHTITNMTKPANTNAPDTREIIDVKVD